MNTKVVNLRDEKYDVYIGRRRGEIGMFGNPFVIGRDGNREEVIAKYKEYFEEQVAKNGFFREKVEELRGKRLGCFCKPEMCHGDVIVKWLEEQESRESEQASDSKSSTTIGIVGSRRRDSESDYQQVRSAVLAIFRQGDILISGGCPTGADAFAQRLANELDARCYIYPAMWDVHGRSAGFYRNTAIAIVSEFLVACVAPDRRGGTEDTINKYLDFHGTKHLILVSP